LISRYCTFKEGTSQGERGGETSPAAKGGQRPRGKLQSWKGRNGVIQVCTQPGQARFFAVFSSAPSSQDSNSSHDGVVCVGFKSSPTRGSLPLQNQFFPNGVSHLSFCSLQPLLTFQPSGPRSSTPQSTPRQTPLPREARGPSLVLPSQTEPGDPGETGAAATRADETLSSQSPAIRQIIWVPSPL